MSRGPLPARIEPRLPALARKMITAFPAEIPVYASLPREQLEGEVLHICHANLVLFLRCVRERRRPDTVELAEPRASAARRAEERVPLEAVLAAYHLGGRIGWRAFADEAEPDEHDELVDIAEGVLRYIEALSGTVAAAYLEEQQLIYGEQRDARRALADALLATTDHDGHTHDRLAAIAERAGVPLAEAYAVAAVRFGRSADERAEGVSAAVAGRRKVRRLVQRLEGVAGRPVLTLLDPAGGTLLMPIDPATADAVMSGAQAAVAELAEAAEADVLAGIAWRSGWADVASAAEEAREAVHIAQRMGAVGGAYTLDDVLLEHTLSTPSQSAARLTALLEPLDAKPDLLATLEAWFAADFDRRAAATALHIHPNTLDYRLRRLVELTGLDPATARGVQLLGAALTARRLC